MIYSMTAFGRAQIERSGYSVTVEVRALNSRFLDTVIRLPKNYLEFEESLRKQVGKSSRRGRIEVFVQIEPTQVERKAPHINLPLARFYWDQLQAMYLELPGADPPKLEHLLRVPYLFEPVEADYDRETLKDILTEALAEALRQADQMKRQEGESLLRDFLERLAALRHELSVIESRKDVVFEEYRKRLRDRMQELMGELAVDENRLLQEVACMAERADINEEIVRLKSHLDHMEGLLTSREMADGRRLDFFTQELHREVNTIGCKMSDLDTAQAVVRMKSEVGKLKEQAQNVE